MVTAWWLGIVFTTFRVALREEDCLHPSGARFEADCLVEIGIESSCCLPVQPFQKRSFGIFLISSIILTHRLSPLNVLNYNQKTLAGDQNITRLNTQTIET